MPSCTRVEKSNRNKSKRDRVARVDLHAKRPFLKLHRENKKNSSSRDDCRSIHLQQRATGNPPHLREPPPALNITITTTTANITTITTTTILLLVLLLLLLLFGCNLSFLVNVEKFVHYSIQVLSFYSYMFNQKIPRNNIKYIFNVIFML